MTDLEAPPLDRDAMRARLAAAEARWLDGVRDTVTDRLEAYVINAGGCPCGGGRDG